MQIIKLFMYPFFTRAVIAGLCLAISASLLGLPLVLKRFSLISDGLGHVSFAAVAVAMSFGLVATPLAIGVCVFISAGLLILKEKTKFNADSLVAVVSCSSLALGVMVQSLKGGLNADINTFMFGSILAINRMDVLMSVILMVATVAFFVLAHRNIFIVTFDEAFAKTRHIKVQVYNGAFSILSSVVVVLGMRVLGGLLISAVIVFPALAGFALCKSYKGVALTSLVFGAVGLIGGLLLSAIIDAPSGASIVLCELVLLLLCVGAGRVIKSVR